MLLNKIGCGDMAIVCIPVVFVGSFVCSMLLTSVMRKVPGLNKVI